MLETTISITVSRNPETVPGWATGHLIRVGGRVVGSRPKLFQAVAQAYRDYVDESLDEAVELV